jgi:hypothetical protein
MSLDAFKLSRAGSRIGAILTDPAELSAMERKSREGRPAVEAVGAKIAASVGQLDDEEKKLVGRWVKQVLGPRGWVPSKKGRVAPGNLFSRGTVYRHLALNASKDRQPAAERVVAARAILAQSPHGVMTPEELIVERRLAFERGE